MLILTRKVGEKIIIGHEIEIAIISLSGDQVRLGIKAPREISVYRSELYEAVQAANRAAAQPTREALGKVAKELRKKQ
jgi:carbon storage regulator